MKENKKLTEAISCLKTSLPIRLEWKVFSQQDTKNTKRLCVL